MTATKDDFDAYFGAICEKRAKNIKFLKDCLGQNNVFMNQYLFGKKKKNNLIKDMTLLSLSNLTHF